ncbi:MAG: 30S ribosomal protein S8 [Candidatus Levybacteria bacterium RIFCSPLOWO2_01_FULL_38_13]|nr:MAG: 30S ribosomal protein S8 [Candidatus Levybacteria bacterium RIFCSPHIGHO2_01_FULL_41_15]OGH34766.1 MAG: 30S ribosomal protein S8 [Candidatus Levybacteria bacterium RIFCSPLOWO2_01_FULL_38_13]
MVNHSVSDFIIRIKNAAKARRREIKIPYTRIGRDIAKVLYGEGFLEEVREEKSGNNKVLSIKLKYKNRVPILTDVQIVSKPSLRIYSSSRNLVANQRKGMYTIILSTNKGIMTGNDAQKKKVGGEALFKIW